MNRSIKKIVSVICSLAMIVSSLTYYPDKEVQAAQSDAAAYNYSGVTYLGCDAGLGYENKVKVKTISGGANRVGIQKKDSKVAIYMNGLTTSPGNIVLNGKILTSGTDYYWQGAGAWFYMTAFTEKYNDLLIYDTSGKLYSEIYIMYEDGTESGGGTTTPPAVTTTPPESSSSEEQNGAADYNYSSLTWLTDATNSDYGVRYKAAIITGSSAFVSVQQNHNMNCFYITTGGSIEGTLSKITVNGTEITSYYNTGDQLFLDTAAITSAYNDVKLYNASGQVIREYYIYDDVYYLESLHSKITDSKTNLALGKQNGSYAIPGIAENSINNMFDGNLTITSDTNTDNGAISIVGWNNPNDASLTIDLGKYYNASTIDKIFIQYKNRNADVSVSGGESYKIQYSVDDDTYTDVTALKTVNELNKLARATLDDVSTAKGAVRYVRIYYPTAKDYGMHITEVAVLADNAQETVLPTCAPPASVSLETVGIGKIKYSVTAGENQDGFKYNVLLNNGTVVGKNVLAGTEYIVEVPAGEHTVTAYSLYQGAMSTGVTSPVVTVNSYESLLQNNQYNIAYGKTFTLSSEKSSEGTGSITDGAIGTTENDYSSTSRNTEGTYFDIDLGNIYTPGSLENVVVWFRSADGETFGDMQIQVSADGTDFTTVGSALKTDMVERAKSGAPFFVDVDITSNTTENVRYVRAYFPKGMTWGAQVTEIGVYDVDLDKTSAVPSGPAVPTGLIYADGKVTWNAVTGAESYQLYINGSATPIEVSGTEYSYELTNSGTYTFAVAAKNSSGSSDVSDSISVGYTKPVTNVSGIGGLNRIKVNWSDDTTEAGNTKYYVYLDGYAENKEPSATHTGKNTEDIYIDATPGNHTVSVISEYKGVRSDEVVSTNNVYVYASAAVEGLVANSTDYNQIDVSWTKKDDSRYSVTITDGTVTVAEDGKSFAITDDSHTMTKYDIIDQSCTFTGVALGDYKVVIKAEVYDKTISANVYDTKVVLYENVVHVADDKPAAPTNISYNKSTDTVTWWASDRATSYNLYITTPDGLSCEIRTSDDTLFKEKLTVNGKTEDKQHDTVSTPLDYAFTKPGIYTLKAEACNATGVSKTLDCAEVEIGISAVTDVVATTNNDDKSISVRWTDDLNYSEDSENQGVQYKIYLDNNDSAATPIATVSDKSYKIENVTPGEHTVYVRAFYEYQHKYYDANKSEANYINYVTKTYLSDAVASGLAKIYADPVAVTDIEIIKNTGEAEVKWNKIMTTDSSDNTIIDPDTTYKVQLLNANLEVVKESNELSGTDNNYTTMSTTLTPVDTGTYTVRVVSIVNGKEAYATKENVFIYPTPIALTSDDIVSIDDYTNANTVAIQIKSEAMNGYATYTAILYDEAGQPLVDENEQFLYKSSANAEGSIVIKNVPEGQYTLKIRTSINGEFKVYTHATLLNIKGLVFPSKLTASSSTDNSISVGWTIGGKSEYALYEYTVNVYNSSGKKVKTITTEAGKTNVEITGLLAGTYKIGAYASYDGKTSYEIFYTSNQTFVYTLDEGSEITVYDSINPPANVVATSEGICQLKFTFTPVANAVSYEYKIYNKNDAEVTSYEVVTENATDGDSNIYYVVGKLTPGKYHVAVRSVREDGKKSEWKASDPEKVIGANLAEVGSITKTVKSTSLTSQDVTITWGVKGDAIKGQYYNVYIEGVKVNDTPITATSFDYSFTATGYYDITIKAAYGSVGDFEYTETEGSSTSIKVALDDGTDKLQNGGMDDLKVEGFQIKTANLDTTKNGDEVIEHVAYRTICKAPNIGSEVVGADGKTYVVKNFGVSYALDENMTGKKRNDVIDSSYNTLDATKIYTTETGVQYLEGIKSYEAHRGNEVANLKARGYIATAKSVLEDWDVNDTTHTYYVLTMNKFEMYVANTIHVRPFIQVVEKGDATETLKYIYANDVASTSVAQIADYIYKNSISKNYAAHKYLFDSILTSSKLKAEYICQNDNNIYYRTTSLNYGWNSNLYVPDSPDIVDSGTLDDLNKETE